MRLKALAILGLLLILAISIYAKARIGNLLPAVLPPTPSTNTTSVDTDTGLNIPSDFEIKVFVSGLTNARDLQITPKGNLFVSTPSQGKIYLIAADGQKTAVLGDLNKPHGLAIHQNYLFVAEETSVKRYVFQEQDGLTITYDKKILDLPKGGRHTSRTMAFDNDGKLYVSLGSSCDVCFEKHPWIGAVIVTDKDGNDPQVFSQGLRNAVFLTLNEKTNKIWSTEMGRDFLGDNLPPDEINILEKRHFGWPVCYGNKVYDTKFGQKTKDFCTQTIPPAFELPAHVAPLGLTFINSNQFPKEWQNDLLVSLHGSWNSSVPVGYKIIRLDVESNKVVTSHDFITGFIQGNQAKARPVDLEFGAKGELYVSDDKSGNIYVLTKK